MLWLNALPSPAARITLLRSLPCHGPIETSWRQHAARAVCALSASASSFAAVPFSLRAQIPASSVCFRPHAGQLTPAALICSGEALRFSSGASVVRGRADCAKRTLPCSPVPRLRAPDHATLHRSRRAGTRQRMHAHVYKIATADPASDTVTVSSLWTQSTRYMPVAGDLFAQRTPGV